MRFEWDEKKNQINQEKHKISFEEVVVHCYRSNDSVIRIISARKATKNERKQYDDHLERR